jgi:CBS domain containing-hemolysin-like protein
MLTRVLWFRSKRVRVVMRPRIEVVALPLEATEADLRALVHQERYSRYAVETNGVAAVRGRGASQVGNAGAA